MSRLKIRNVVPFSNLDGGGNGEVNDGDRGAGHAARPRRADARRNKETLLDAAAAIFVTSGVEAPVRDIAAKAGVGTATIYRHFPTRADLIIAVYRHQVEACAEAGPALLATSVTPYAALGRWIDLFVDFLVTKHGLAAALRSDDAGFDALHAYFLDRLVPVCTELLDAAAGSGEIRSDLEAYELMRGVGNLCIGADSDPRYDARRLVGILIAGLRRPH
ncbi:TetR/AcrR family transcriptional regulator [Microtetraspora fusca]|uniref:TetR/AcrR family transcriptional regulator n=1 Tax=Microtetraspora fusca TaxID=1997 RepID=A0ABW6V0B1_MICFU